MSEKEKPAKKAARKRVVKKATRNSRKSPEEETSPLEEAQSENSGASSRDTEKEDDATKAVSSSDPTESQHSLEKESGESAPGIAVVEESPDNHQDRSPSKDSNYEEDRKDKKKNFREENDGGDDRRDGNRKRNRNRRGGGNRDRDEDPSNQQGHQVDAEEVAEKGWEIYQAELEEEGVSLVDPRRGREIARRCLELASVFCEERDRFLKKQS